jgi:hypothetical protein
MLITCGLSKYLDSSVQSFISPVILTLELVGNYNFYVGGLPTRKHNLH